MSGSLRLSILVEAIDRASQPLAALQARLGGIAAGMLAVGQAAQRLSNVSGASLLAGALGNVAGRARDAAGAVAGLSARLAIGAAGGAFLFNQQFVRGAADFQRYRSTLETVMGSAEAAQKRLDELSRFATRTPFSLPEVVSAGVALETFGVRGAAADRALQGAGNAAYAFRTSLDQAITAMSAAGRGELDPIERFGIQARTEGRAIVMQWEQDGKQMRATIDKNNRAGIMATVARAWNGMAPGAMEKAMDQWDGLLSNVKDAWSSFTRTIAEAGPFQFLEQQLRDILAWVERLKEDGRLDQWAQQIGAAITNAFQAIRQFVVGTEETPGALARIEAMFQRVSSVFSPVIERFGGLETLLVAMGVLLGGPLIAALVSLTGAMATLGVVLALTPVGWFAMAAAGIAAIGVAIYSNWDRIVGLFGRLSAAWRGFMNSDQMQESRRIFASIANFITERWNAVGQVFTNIGGTIRGVFEALAGFITERWNALAAVLLGFGDAVLRMLPAQAIQEAQRIFGGLADFITERWNALATVLRGFGDAVVRMLPAEAFQEAQRIFGGLADFITERWNAVGQVFTTIGSTIQGVLSNVMGYFQPVRDALGWVMDRVPGFGGGGGSGAASAAAVAPTPRDAGRGNGLRRQSIYGENALPDGAGGGVMPPANDVRVQAGLDVQIRAPEGFGVSVTQRSADEGMALNVRRGMLATP